MWTLASVTAMAAAIPAASPNCMQLTITRMAPALSCPARCSGRATRRFAHVAPGSGRAPGSTACRFGASMGSPSQRSLSQVRSGFCSRLVPSRRSNTMPAASGVDIDGVGALSDGVVEWRATQHLVAGEAVLGDDAMALA